MKLDVIFPVLGESLPTDHVYPLYGALSGIVPQLHEPESSLRFAPIGGTATANGTLVIGPSSYLRIRVPDGAIREVLPLSGKRLEVAGCSVRLGTPRTQTLLPTPVVQARFVTFKNSEEPAKFLETARSKLAELGVSGDPQLPIHIDGERAGEPKRRIVRIHGVSIVGFALVVAELSAADSIRLQESGLGGRTQIGCGFFMPVKRGQS